MPDAPREPLVLELRAIRAQNSGAEIALQIAMTSGEQVELRVLTVATEDFLSLGLKKGRIEQETFEILERADAILGATRCGERLLAYAAQTERTLVRKLMQRGYGREEAEIAVERLATKGLIDEEREMEREVERCLSKLWGARRIREQLYARGYGKEALSRLPDLLAEIDLTANCEALIRRRYGGAPSDRDAERRLIAALYRYGYATDEIRTALQAVKNE